MDDPATIAINLTFLGTLGLAFLMFLALGVLVVVTLVLAGVARLLSIILLAMVGIYPKRDAVPVTHLPPQPRRATEPPKTSDESTTANASSPGTGLLFPEEPRLGVMGGARLVLSTSWAALREIPWKSLMNPRTWPKPAQVKAGIVATATAVATTQAKEHPFVVAVKHDPPVLNREWAAAVAEADIRAAARAQEASAKPEAGKAPVPAEKTTKENGPKSSLITSLNSPVPEHQGEPHGGKPVPSGHLKTAVGARPQA